MRDAWIWLWLLGVSVGACRDPARPGAGRDARRTPGGEPSAAASASVRTEPSAALPPLLGDGCQAGLDLGGALDAVLARVANACIPGSAVLLRPVRVASGSETRVHVEAAACLRVAAVVGSDGGNLELELGDANGRVIARDGLPGPIALVGSRGPVCVRSAGDYRVVARAARSGEPIELGVWRSE